LADAQGQGTLGNEKPTAKKQNAPENAERFRLNHRPIVHLVLPWYSTHVCIVLLNIAFVANLFTIRAKAPQLRGGVYGDNIITNKVKGKTDPLLCRCPPRA